MQFQKEQLLLYAITDKGNTDNETFFTQIREALEGGITMLQLREKILDETTFIEEAKKIKDLCHAYNVPLIINDNLNVAIQSGADGIHVGITDTPVREIRKKTNRHFIIGATAKTIAQAKTAEADGADYLGVGAVFPSPTKQNAIRITKQELHTICTSVTIPAVAIGGINKKNIPELSGGGMSGIAVVSAIFAAKNIKTATENLKETITNIIKTGEPT